MKKSLLFTFAILLLQPVTAQINYRFNNLLYPLGIRQSEFYHIFQNDTCYYLEGVVDYGWYGNPLTRYKVFLKTDLLGNVLKTVSFDESLIDRGGKYYNTVKQIRTGFIIASYVRDSINTHCLLMSINYNLDTLWTRKFHSKLFDSSAVYSYFTDIKQDADLSYLITGHISMTYGNYQKYPFILKVDKMGNLIWLKKFFTNQFLEVQFRRLELTPDSGIILLSNLNKGSIIKTDDQGNILWIADIPNDSIFANDGDIEYFNNSDYIVAAPYMYSFIPGSPNYGIIKEGVSITSINYITGQVNWHKKHIPFDSFESYPTFQVHILSDKVFAVSATASSIYDPKPNLIHKYRDEGVLLKYNALGDNISKMFFKNDNQVDCWLNYMCYNPRVGLIGAGSAQGLDNVQALAWFFRIGAGGFSGITDTPDELTTYLALNTYPVPARDAVFFDFGKQTTDESTLILYSIEGMQVLSENLSQGESVYPIDIHSLTPGLYLYQILVGGITRNTGKIVVE